MDVKESIDSNNSLWNAKKRAHERFDILWQSDENSAKMRLLAYQWLGLQLGDVATIIDGGSDVAISVV